MDEQEQYVYASREYSSNKRKHVEEPHSALCLYMVSVPLDTTWIEYSCGFEFWVSLNATTHCFNLDLK